MEPILKVYPVTYGWIGATDDENQSGTNFEEDEKYHIMQYSLYLNASEGDWKWLNGKDINDIRLFKLARRNLSQ